MLPHLTKLYTDLWKSEMHFETWDMKKNCFALETHPPVLGYFGDAIASIAIRLMLLYSIQCIVLVYKIWATQICTIL